MYGIECGTAARWTWGLACVFTLCGCGPQLVEPGQSGPPATQVPSTFGTLSPPTGAVVPAEDRPANLTELPQVPAETVIPDSPESQPARYHEVIRGDTLTSIARKYGTTVEQLLSLNGLQREDVLLPGQLIAIP